MTAAARRPSIWVSTCLAVVSVALVVTGVVFLTRAHQLRDDGAMRNRAFVDTAATQQVIGQVSTALNAVLSYDYAHPDTAKASAAKWLAGGAPAQYRVLFNQLQSLAPGQKLSLVAKVVTSGVTFLDANRARLLVFVDQQSTRASDHRSSVSAAQIQISATKHGSRWQITDLKPL